MKQFGFVDLWICHYNPKPGALTGNHHLAHFRGVYRIVWSPFLDGKSRFPLDSSPFIKQALTKTFSQPEGHVL